MKQLIVWKQTGMRCIPISPSNTCILFLTFYFVLGYSLLTNNIVIVLSEQQRNSAIHIHVSVLPQVPLPARLPQNIEQSSMCYTVGHVGYSSKIQQCVHVHPKLPNSLSVPSFPPATISSFLKSESLFLSCMFI